MHTPAYKPITPQQQHTNPSRSCVRTCVLDLRFVVPLLEFFTLLRNPASGILKSRRWRTGPPLSLWRRLFRVKWRSQCLKTTASLRHLARLLQTPLYGYVKESSRSRWRRWSQRAESSVNMWAFTSGQSAKHKIEFKRDKVEKTPPPPRPYEAINRQTGMYKGDYEYFEGFHTEDEDEAKEYWRGAGRELHWTLLERRAWSVHTRCTQGAHTSMKSMIPL